jgi:drug/metabolite transporter (DMT)-like permease
VTFLGRQSDRAAVMLTVATLFWGLSFPLNKSWQLEIDDLGWSQSLSAATLIALRIGAALVVFAVFRPTLVIGPSWQAHATGLWLGAFNLTGFMIQVVGLAWTTPARAGFFTSLASVWTPLLAWLLFRIHVSVPVLIGLFLGISGAAVLGLNPAENWIPGRGDAMTFASSFIFAGVIVALDRQGRKYPAGHLTAGYLAGTGVPALLIALCLAGQEPGLGPWLRQARQALARPEVLRDVALLTILCSLLATHLLTVYQPRLSASRAALIYLLEPVFASIFSLGIGHDELTAQLIAGGSCILLGNLVVELPRLWREFRGPA